MLTVFAPAPAACCTVMLAGEGVPVKVTVPPVPYPSVWSVAAPLLSALSPAVTVILVSVVV